jgi:hypothetical protein
MPSDPYRNAINEMTGQLAQLPNLLTLADPSASPNSGLA